MSEMYTFVTVYHMPGAGMQMQAYYEFTEAFLDGGALSINWVLFGSSHQSDYSPEPVVERFTRREKYLNSHVKTISYLPHVDTSENCHYAKLKHGLQQVDTRGNYFIGATTNHSRDMLVEEEQIAVLHHYFTKSEGEFRLKIARGRSDYAHEKRGMEDFAVHDRNEVEDRSAADFYRHMTNVSDSAGEMIVTDSHGAAQDIIDTTESSNITNNTNISKTSTSANTSSIDYSSFYSLFDSNPPPAVRTPLFEINVRLELKNRTIFQFIDLVIYAHEAGYVNLAIIRFCVDQQLLRNTCVTLTNLILDKYNAYMDEQSAALYEEIFAFSVERKQLVTSAAANGAGVDSDEKKNYTQCHRDYWTAPATGSDLAARGDYDVIPLVRSRRSLLVSATFSHALFSHTGRYEDYADQSVALRIFNSTSYQLHPFVFERLPAFFLAAERARVCQG
eukprot:gene27587-34330_t